jgi:tetratricopeptide (TPR) repeat protein
MTDIPSDVTAVHPPSPSPRLAINRVVIVSLLGLVLLDFFWFISARATIQAHGDNPHVSPSSPVLVDFSAALAIGSIVVISAILIMRLGRARKRTLSQLGHEPLLLFVLLLAVVNLVLLAVAPVVPTGSQLQLLSGLFLIGLACLVFGLVHRSQVFKDLTPGDPNILEAVDAARAGITTEPESAAAWSTLVTALTAAGRKSEAAEASKELVRLAPDAWWSHLIFSEASDGWIVGPEGLAAAKEAVRLAPDEPATHQALGNAFLRRNKRREARAAFAAALRIDPMDADVRQNLAVAESVASPASAVVGFTDVARSDPQNRLVTYNLRVSLGTIFARSWYIVAAGVILTFVLLGLRADWGLSDVASRAVLVVIDSVVVGAIALLVGRILRSGRARSLVRFVFASDLALSVLGCVLAIGLAAMLAITFLPPPGQVLMFALLFLLFVVSQIMWFVWQLAIREAGRGL